MTNCTRVSCLFVFQKKNNYSVMLRSMSTRSGYPRMPNDNMLPTSPPALRQTNAQGDIFANQMSVKGNTTHWSQKYRQTKKVERSLSQPPLNSSGQVIGNNNFASNQFFIGCSTVRRPPSAHSISEPKLSAASRTKSEING